MIGRLEYLNIREVWAKEAKDFSTWLENNLDLLSELIGFSLTLIEREKSAGVFWADMVAEGANGETVVIENQLEKTDHDHLGKLITYLSNLESKTAIWITTQPRQEHINAINWLNEISPADTAFFLLKLQAVRIGNSEPAPLFTVICEPSEESKEIGEQKQELAEIHRRRKEFWKQLLEKASKKTSLHANLSPTKDNWLITGAGKSGVGWLYLITQKHGSVELCIDCGPGKKDETDRIFEKFYNKREKIEEQFGEKLIWDRKEGRRVCRIKSISKLGGLEDTHHWDAVQEDLIDRMVRLEKALKPLLRKIQ